MARFLHIYTKGAPEQALGWFPLGLGLGLVVEGEPLKVHVHVHHRKFSIDDTF